MIYDNLYIIYDVFYMISLDKNSSAKMHRRPFVILLSDSINFLGKETLSELSILTSYLHVYLTQRCIYNMLYKLI